jgi:hypothetical protein
VGAPIATISCPNGGKIVASPHPLYWIEDHDKRRRAVSKFFRAATPLRARRRIAKKYDAKFILLDTRRVELTQHARDDFFRLGSLVYEGGGMQLIAIHPQEPSGE